MYSLCTARNTLSRCMSSLVPGHVLQGTRWNYRILNPVKGDNTHISTVFKAEVIARENVPNSFRAPQWAFIKTASPTDLTAMKNMDREIHTYRLPDVPSAECFRKLYDVIDDNTIALEWMDTTLAEVKYQPDLRTYALIATILRAALTSCVVLEGHGYVNTDYKPANILLSGIETGRVTAKVGDLGLVVPTGTLFNAQPYAMRAPEVYLGQACTAPSQIWAVAAMLLCWVKPGILGAWDSPHFIINEAWSMAKIKRLFPHWRIPASEDVNGHTLKAVVDAATYLAKEAEVEVLGELKGVLGVMLVPEMGERPSAASVLASREFGALGRVAGVLMDC
ncbi:hypothetical protein BJX76DRAFT_349646 [Aspergillus varians]